MKTLLSLFPNASKDCQKANQESVIPGYNVDGTKRTRRGKMNKTEAEFALMLEVQKQEGKIRDYLFQPMSLPWAGMKYTPDFMVTPNSGYEKRRMIEVKGPHIHYRQQAIARFKGARSYWPEFTFELWQKIKEAGWKQLK